MTTRGSRALARAGRWLVSAVLHLPVVLHAGRLDTVLILTTLVSLVLGGIASDPSALNLAGTEVRLRGAGMTSVQILVQYAAVALCLVILLIDTLAVWKLVHVIDPRQHAVDAREYSALLKELGLEGVRQPADQWVIDYTPTY